MKFLFVFLLLVQTAAFGQKRISKVTYHCTTHLLNGNALAGKTVLYFTDTASLYIHKDFPEKDTYGGLNSGDGGRKHIVSYIKGDPEGMPVYINRLDSVMIYKSEYPNNPPKVPFFMFKERLPKIKWEIVHNEKKLISGLSAIHAYGEFGSRTYDVWFTLDIPVSYGPYKLWGLPGLILEAKSLDGKVIFKFMGFEESTKDVIEIVPPKQGKLVSEKQLKEFLINSLLRVESRGTSVTNRDPPADYTIEKSKFHYLSEYKKARPKSTRQW